MQEIVRRVLEQQGLVLTEEQIGKIVHLLNQMAASGQPVTETAIADLLSKRKQA